MSIADDDARAIGRLLQEGRAAEAREAVSQALAAGRDGDAMLAFAGMVAASCGDAAGAAGHLERLLARRPEDRATRLNLAGALVALERFDEVPPLLAMLPRDPTVDRIAAFAALQLGDALHARDLYRDVTRAVPGDADSWANLGGAEAALTAFGAAVSALEQAITVRRGDVRFYLALADVLDRAGRPTERLRVMQDAAAIAPGSAEVLLALGLAQAAADAPGPAEESLRRAISAAPDDPAAYLELGLMLETQNRIDALEALILQAGERIGPELDLLRAWSAFRANRVAEAATIAASIPATISELRRYQLLAQLADRTGAATEAFALFGRMNAASLAASPVALGPTYCDSVQAATAALRAAPPVAAIVPDDGIASPVFIAGFPRSGTTLLDTMLGRLPDTVILEEQPFIPTIQQEIGAPENIATLDAVAVARLRRRYHMMLERHVPDAGSRRAIDKHPLHMARMPLIHRLFPGASILLVERHPCDVVLSCYMANFRLNHAMRSFVNIEEAAQTYDAVFTAWQEAEERLALNVRRVRYERLVVDPEVELRGVLDHLEAKFDPAILDNVAGARERGSILTASYSQVTEPLYQRAVARWRRYESELAGVMPILAPWAARMGYEI